MAAGADGQNASPPPDPSQKPRLMKPRFCYGVSFHKQNEGTAGKVQSTFHGPENTYMSFSSTEDPEYRRV
ncbi:uncharacterized [Tachysurus ichikawai]